MKVKIKKVHPDAKMPKYAKFGDAGLDLTAISKDRSFKFNEIRSVVTFGTGLSIEIPEGYVGLIFPRSSVSKTYYHLANSVGVIDSSYRGEILVKMREAITAEGEPLKDYEVGEKIAQLIIIPYPQIELEEVDELSDTERGEGGFGSTGNR